MNLAGKCLAQLCGVPKRARLVLGSPLAPLVQELSELPEECPKEQLILSNPGGCICISPVVAAFLCTDSALPRPHGFLRSHNTSETHHTDDLYRIVLYISPPCASFWAEA